MDTRTLKYLIENYGSILPQIQQLKTAKENSELGRMSDPGYKFTQDAIRRDKLRDQARAEMEWINDPVNKDLQYMKDEGAYQDRLNQSRRELQFLQSPEYRDLASKKINDQFDVNRRQRETDEFAALSRAMHQKSIADRQVKAPEVYKREYWDGFGMRTEYTTDPNKAEIWREQKRDIDARHYKANIVNQLNDARGMFKGLERSRINGLL